MSVPLDDLIATSDGSRLIAYSFRERVIRVQIHHEALKSLVLFECRCDTVYGRSVPADARRSRCRLVLVDLAERLFVNQGEYVPSTEPEVARHEARAHFNLAYGRRTSDVRWLMSLRGEYTLLAFLIRDVADLSWTLD